MSNIKVICDRDDLVAIADGFRTSRGITNELNLGEMAELAAEKVSDGGSGGSLEGLINGYDVMFYDENNEGLAFYSIKQGHTIEAPVYNCKQWQDADGGVVTFPYTPTADAIFYANNNEYTDVMYEHFNVNKAIYPCMLIRYNGGNQVLLVFFEKFTTSNTASKCLMGNVQTLTSVISDKNSKDEIMNAVMSVVTELIARDELNVMSSTGYYYYCDADSYDSVYAYRGSDSTIINLDA